MIAFNRMTIVAAAEVIADFKSHGDMRVLEVQWDIDGRTDIFGQICSCCKLGKTCL